MSNPEPEATGPDKPDAANGQSRDVDQITIRDLDKIQEKTPFTLKPVHIKIVVAAAAGLLFAGIAAGWLIGQQSANDGAKTSGIDLSDLKKLERLAGKNEDVTTKSARKNTGRNVRGSVLPLNEVTARPAADTKTDRRGPVQPEPDHTPVWFAQFVRTECAFTCIIPYCGCEKDPIRKTVDKNAALPQKPETKKNDSKNQSLTQTEKSSESIQDTALAGAKPTTVGKIADKTKTRTDKKTVTGTKKETTAKAAKKKTTRLKKKADPKKRPRTKPVRKIKRFSVQIRSFKKKALAAEFAGIFKTKGYNTFVVRYVNPSGKAWYRVRAGHFDTADEASAFAARINARESEKSIPVETK